MSSRPILPPFPVITNGDLSTTITSKVSIIQNITLVSYDISWSGAAPIGDIAVQVSNTYAVNDQGIPINNNPTWATVILSAPTSISGNTGTGFIQLSDLSAYAIRLVYTPTSGTGTLTATVVGKVE